MYTIKHFLIFVFFRVFPTGNLLQIKKLTFLGLSSNNLFTKAWPTLDKPYIKIPDMKAIGSNPSGERGKSNLQDILEASINLPLLVSQWLVKIPKHILSYINP